MSSTYIDRRFAWQAWHLWDWAGSWGPLVARDAAALLRGRGGTWRHPLALCVAVVALGDIDRARQVWHLLGGRFLLMGLANNLWNLLDI